LSKDNKTLFVRNEGGLSKIETESGKITGISVSAEMVLNTEAERNYIFNRGDKPLRNFTTQNYMV
jgi:phosphatidylserine decarboxylase